MTTTSEIEFLTKKLYAKGYSDRDLYKNKPGLQAAKKVTDFDSHEGMYVSLDANLGSGIGLTHASAYANRSASKGVRVLVPQAHLTGYVELDGEVFRNASARGGNEGKVIEYAKSQFSKGLETMMEELARFFHASKTGSRGVIESVTTTTIVLTERADCLFFRPGQIIGATATDGGALRSGTPGYATITKVNPSTRTLTFAADLTVKIGSITAGDFVVQYGVAEDNATVDSFWGMETWNPLTPATLGGADLTVAPTQLTGSRYTAGGPLETIFIRALGQAMADVGTDFMEGEIYLSPQQFANLVASKTGAKLVDDAKMHELGIRKMTLDGYTFVRDAFCKETVARIAPKSAMELHTAGAQPKWEAPFKDPTTGLVQVDGHVDGNFICPRPRDLVRVTLPAL